MDNKIKSKSAFTLAEVLITLVIVGIVSVMVISPIISDVKDKQDVIKLKKTYSAIDYAIKSASSEYGSVKFWENDDNVHDYISKRLSVVRKNFSFNTIPEYFPHYNLNGNRNEAHIALYQKAMILNDGVFVGTSINPTSWSRCSSNNNEACFGFFVDINGAKRPNRYGYDMFIFDVMPDGQIKNSRYLKGTNRCNPLTDTTTSGVPNGTTCGYWVIRKGNMDYKKCIKGDSKYCNIDYSIL